MFPAECQRSVSIFHLPTTAGAKQPYPAIADATTFGAFLPMDTRTHVFEGGDMVDPHELYVSSVTDIRVGDKLSIDSVTYFVKRVFTASFGGMAHRRCSISREP